MTRRENLFQPIHKGIRSMLYELGSRLQTTDFANVSESNRFAQHLKRDLNSSLSSCVLCLLRAHSNHEERDLFAKVRVHDADAIDLVMKEHAEVSRRIRDVATTCDEVLKLDSAARRIELGDRLTLEVNDLFANYLTHLNNEEAVLVPIMWERFTDEELRAMRSVFYDHLPHSLFEVWMRWTLPSLNMNELLVLYSGLKTSADPERWKDWVRMAHETLDLARLRGLEDQVGLGAG
jgi:Hemerythrin HHE cation binding domain